MEPSKGKLVNKSKRTYTEYRPHTRPAIIAVHPCLSSPKKAKQNNIDRTATTAKRIGKLAKIAKAIPPIMPPTAISKIFSYGNELDDCDGTQDGGCGGGVQGGGCSGEQAHGKLPQTEH
jgi:hypothetical protein